MNTLTWLTEQQVGFGDLPDAEKVAMLEFTLLWAYFEANWLDTNANGPTIRRLAEYLAAKGVIDLALVQEPLVFWRARYVQDGNFTDHFGFLYLRDRDNVQIVESVLRGENDSPTDVLTCVLTLVFRYRNNLFHGLKWAYGLRDQVGNFTRANQVLIAIAEMAKRGR